MNEVERPLSWHYIWAMKVRFICCRQRRRVWALDNDEILLTWINDHVFPHRDAVHRWPFVHYKVASALWLTIEPFHKFVRSSMISDTLGPGAFDLAPVVAMAAPHVGYLSPKWPTATWVAITTRLWRRRRWSSCWKRMLWSCAEFHV